MSVSVTGDGAFLVAAPLLAAALTQDPLLVSAVVAVAYLPWLLVGLPVGALVDRTDRLSTMIAADVCRAVLLAVIVVAVLTGLITVSVLILVVALVGVAQTFFDSAAQAFIPSVVGRDRAVLTKVNGRVWAADAAGRTLLGPPLGSLAFSLAHVLPFAFDALSFVVSAVFVRRLPQVRVTRSPRGSIGPAIGVGLRHLIGNPELRFLALGTAAYNFGYHVAAGTLVLYVTVVLDLSNAMYGILLAVGAVGGVASAWFATVVFRVITFRQVMAIATFAQAFGWLLIAVAANPWVMGVTLTVVGACSSLVSVAVGAVRQQMTPDDLLGRVVSTFRFLGLGASGLGALTGGVVADVYGLATPLVISGVLLVLVGVGLWRHV